MCGPRGDAATGMSHNTDHLHSEPPADAGAGEAGRGENEHTWLLRTVRYLLPAVVVIVGIVFMAMGSQTDLEGGAAVVSAGLAIYFINWLFRTGAAGDREREAEDAARDYYERHGRWPD
jgi:hypothetical protein